jgi:predicted enzyme related to lactoylglutathione lyase
MGPIGKLRTIAVRVNDMDNACRFYQKVLGFELRFRDGDRWAQFEAGGAGIALAGKDEQPGDNSVALNIKVEDMDAAIARLRESGVAIVEGPTVGPHEVRCALRDPDGHVLYLYTPRAS